VCFVKEKVKCDCSGGEWVFFKKLRYQLQIQFPLICLCHQDGFRDVILSPKDFGGKYVKFNRLVEMTTKIPWEEPLKESAKIALGSPKLR
jgi:hypothetical protein